VSSVVAPSPAAERRLGPGGDGNRWSLPTDGLPVFEHVVVDREHRTISCELFVPRELRVLRDHFPAAPVVPGVMQVAWAVELACRHGLASGPLRGILTAKFRRLVLPGMRLAAHVESGPAAGQCCFVFELDGEAVSTGRLQFGAGRD